MEDIFDIFYTFYLKVEIERREEAIALLNDGNYSKLKEYYIHYVGGKNKEEEITDLSIDGVLSQITEIKNNLPKNAADVYIDNSRNPYDDNEDDYICVRWTEYSIVSVDKCSSLARCWTSDAIFKMNKQPNGKDGKAAIALYKNLTS